MVRDPGTEQPAVLHSFHLHPLSLQRQGTSEHDQVFVAPDDVPANFAELVARLKVIESAMSDLLVDQILALQWLVVIRHRAPIIRWTRFSIK